MAGDLLLVGSIPVETAEQAFRQVGTPLGAWLDYMPDGEVGLRSYWVDGIAYRVFNGHPEIETIKRPAPDEDGVEWWKPRGRHDEFAFRVKPGINKVRFGDPGLASAMGTVYLVVMLAVAIVAILSIWRPGSDEKP